MPDLKTKATGKSVAKFIGSIKEEGVRKDCQTLTRLMSQATGPKPKMWGSSIIGFGSYHYHYASGREGGWFTTGFSPRKQNLTLNVIGGFASHTALLKKLGKHSLGKGCLYLKSLDEIRIPTLKKLIQQSVKEASRFQQPQ